MISSKLIKKISILFFLFIPSIFIVPIFGTTLLEDNSNQVSHRTFNDTHTSEASLDLDTTIISEQPIDVVEFEPEDGYEESMETSIEEDEDDDTTTFLDTPEPSSGNLTESNESITNELEKIKQLELKKLAKTIERKKKLVIYENKVNTLLTDIDGIKEELTAKRLNQTLQLLSSLTSKIKTIQTNYILSFFPDTFLSYTLTIPNKSNEGLIPEDASLFTISYRSTENPNQIIDINIIVSDDSIQEYLHIINHPELLPELINTTLITLRNGGYKTLEKYRESEQFCERNIVINSELMINVIFYNLDSKQDIDNFLDQINIKKLEAYLLE